MSCENEVAKRDSWSFHKYLHTVARSGIVEEPKKCRVILAALARNFPAFYLVQFKYF
jgi:hypothetical protein